MFGLIKIEYADYIASGHNLRHTSHKLAWDILIGKS